MLSDVTMPGMTGIDLSYQIRELYPDMPVAIVSGDVSELERSIIGRSDVPFIKKPFHAESLYSAVREAIRAHPQAGRLERLQFAAAGPAATRVHARAAPVSRR